MAEERESARRLRGRLHSGPREADSVFLAAASDPTVFGARDAALLALLGDAGLEDHELTRLEVRDVDWESGEVRVARNGEIARIALSRRATQALETWLRIRGRVPGALFHPLERPESIVRKRISRVLVHDVVRRRSLAAGVRPITPGDLSRARTSTFRCPAAARFLARHAQAMRLALTERLDRLAGILSDGALDARGFDWTGVSAEQVAAVTGMTGVSQRQLNEMRTALLGVLREAVESGAMTQEAYGAIHREVWGAARRTT